MNFEPIEPANLANTQDFDLCNWEQLENLVESLIEQDRQDKIKTKRSSPEELARAIAKILPAAIEREIQSNPEAIAKAIAPEIALSIRKQIALDEEAIPQTLGPEMGKAIKAQIESEKDAMVDALYPVIGSTIAKYMVEVVQDINHKIESTLSPEGFKRKFRAKMQGVSEAELIFKESIGYHVRAIFLIAKDSGLVIQEIQIAGEKHLDADMLAGMLTAIRSFANDCIVSDSELDSIDYGDWQIPIEVAGYCYLAVIVAGEPPKEFITKIRRVLGEIVLKYDRAIRDFDGNLATVPVGIESKLQQLIEENQKKRRKSASPLLLWLAIAILIIILVPWGMNKHRTQRIQQIEQQTAIELDAVPELSVYRLDPEIDKDRLIITGRVPSREHRDRAEQIVRPIAEQNNLKLNNQILTVDVPVDPSLATGEIQRLTNLFNRQPGVEIETTYRDKILTVTGHTLNNYTRQITQAFSQIPGVERVIFKLDDRLPKIPQRIYFDSGSTKVKTDSMDKIAAIAKILKQYPAIHLKLTAHSDGIGAVAFNQRLGRKRCNKVKQALSVRGIDSSRLMDSCDSLSLTQEDNDSAARSERYVSFEPFIPLNQ